MESEKDKFEQGFEKYVWKIINEYIPILFLQANSIYLFKRPDNMDDANDYSFKAIVNTPYTDVIIYYTDEAVCRWIKKDESLEKDIVHELSHIIQEPLYDAAVERFMTDEALSNILETATDKFAKTIFALNAQNKKLKKEIAALKKSKGVK